MRHEVEERTGYRVSWQVRAMDDADTRAAIETLLAEPLTVEGAIKIALTNNRALQAEFENVGITLGQVASASVLNNPEMDAELRLPLDGGPSTLDLALMQDIMSLFTLGGRRDVALADLKAARLQATGAVLTLIAEVQMAVYRVQADMQLLELRQTTTDAASVGLELTQRLREAGNVDELTVAQDELLLNEAKLNLAGAELRVATSREALNTLLGLSGGGTRWRIEAPLAPLPDQPLDTQDLETVAIRESLALEQARWTMKGLASAIGLARVESWLPHLAIGASAERETGGDWAVGPALSLSVPIFDRQQGSRASGHAKLRQAQHRYTATAVSVRAQARAASATLKAARAKVLYLHDVVIPLRKRVLGETLKLYNAMSRGPFEVLQAKREEVRSGADYVEALYEYWSAQAVVEALSRGGMSTPSAATTGESADAPSRGH